VAGSLVEALGGPADGLRLPVAPWSWNPGAVRPTVNFQHESGRVYLYAIVPVDVVNQRMRANPSLWRLFPVGVWA